MQTTGYDGHIDQAAITRRLKKPDSIWVRLLLIHQRAQIVRALGMYSDTPASLTVMLDEINTCLEAHPLSLAEIAQALTHLADKDSLSLREAEFLSGAQMASSTLGSADTACKLALDIQAHHYSDYPNLRARRKVNSSIKARLARLQNRVRTMDT